MNITSAAIEAFKNILKVEFVSNGNHIILRGTNGSGKSAILDALMVAFFGKKLLPEDPILHGHESAKIQFDIGNGEVKAFTVSVSIKKDNFSVAVTGYTVTGQKATIKSPVAFLESIMLKDAADPQAFFAKSDKEQVEMLFQICPTLKPELDRIAKEYEEIQKRRSEIKADGQRKAVEFEKLVYTAGLPETEIDPAELMEELAKANQHNNKKEDLEKIVQNNKNAVTAYSAKKESSEKRILRLKSQIEQLQNDIKEEEAEVASCDINIISAQQGIDTIEKELANFVEIDTEEIKTRINQCSAKNQQIRNNAKYKTLEKEIECLREQYSQGLKDMQAKEQEKVDVIKAAQMPVEGLSIGDGCLMFPDPNTGELVRIKSLSTGQQWSVVIGILAAFLPAPDKGMRVLVVKNLNDLDEKNYLAMLDAANKNGIQLIMHQTVMKSDSSQCEIIIQD